MVVPYDKVKKLIGKRIRITKPTEGWSSFSKSREPVSMWCAGDVPVGSTGTIVDYPDSPCLCQIQWDHGQKPKKGYVFGISGIREEHGIEEITDE